MKIVQVMESSATGTLAMVRLIANWFAREGHEVHVIYSIRDETPADIHAMFDCRVVLRHVQMRGVPLLPVVVRLRSVLSEIQPDVIHLHSSVAGFLGRIASLFAARRSTVLYSPHCISFMRRDISSLTRFTFVAFEWMATIRKCLYVACSESERQAIRSYLRQPVVVVENAVSEMQVRPPLSLSRNAPAVKYVVTVGGIRPQKNPLLFAEIANGLRNSGLRFIWIGDGDAALKAQLRAAGVEVTGWVSRAQVEQQLRQACVYLSTSSWEGMPVAVIEAMLLGVPVVVSACAGNVDIIRPAHTGAVFTTCAEAMEFVTEFASDHLLRGLIAARAQREAMERFAEARFVQQLAPFYARRLVS
ncbi:glycosyltransferase family 4 protein [Paraburkholderia sediminicola]|uniref:glycosyltransferase family 4 protein n=1 Tax=Paraburkholderia sediminicola TaxID=458836 RepID=UPI0038B7F528